MRVEPEEELYVPDAKHSLKVHAALTYGCIVLHGPVVAREPTKRRLAGTRYHLLFNNILFYTRAYYYNNVTLYYSAERVI